MLIKFDSSISGEMLMHADAAKRLLQIIGKECTARGVMWRRHRLGEDTCHVGSRSSTAPSRWLFDH